MKPLYPFVFILLLLASCSKDNNGSTQTDDDNQNQSEFLGELDWVKTFGGSGEDEAIDMIQANDGNYVIVGSSNSTDGDLVGRSGSDFDFWILKVSETGDKIWSHTYGGSDTDRATSIAKTTDGGYIISGYTKSNDGDVSENAGFYDYWILKVDDAGNKQWDKNFGFLGTDQAFKIITTNEGGYFVTGYLDVTASGGEGNDLQDNNNTRETLHGLGEYWGIKVDANGNKIWRRYFGGTNNDRSYDVIQTTDNGFLLVGTSESIDVDISNPKGSYDFWAVKTDANGNKLWEKSYGGSEIDNGWAITHTADGNYLFIGDTRSEDQDVTNHKENADCWVVKINNSNGNIIWEKVYGGTHFDSSRSISNLSNGNFVISGNSRSVDGDITNPKGVNDAWVFIINENGTLQFQKSIGGSGLDFANDAIETSNNEIIVIGSTESNDFDIAQNRGSKDLFISKIK
ncbi:MAG: hypothetical protein ACWA45_05325 [Flavobacteriales bacterium]